MSSLIQPLAFNVPIVDPKTGNPTAQFARLLQQLALAGELTNTNGQIGIADGGVTLAKLANLATQRVIGRNSAGTGVPEAVTLSQLLDWIGGAARGDILYRGAAGWARLGAGVAGQVLQTAGLGADPAWAAAGGSAGALVLLEQHTAAASASLDFTAGISATYDEYIFELVNVLNATNSAIPWIRMSTNGGVSYDAGANYNDYWHSRSLATFSGNGNLTDTKIQMNNNGHVNTFNYGISGQFRLFSPLSTTQHKSVNGSFVACDGGASGWISDCQFSGRYMSLTAVNAIRFMFSAGNITSGTIRMYGVAK